MKDKLHLRRLLFFIERELNQKPMKPVALRKVKQYLNGMEKPKQETLDKLSLFVGFQDWQSFKATLNGQTDGLVNYEDPQDNDNTKGSSSP